MYPSDPLPPSRATPPRTRRRPPRAPGLALLFAATALLPRPGLAEDWLRWGGPAGDFTAAAGTLVEVWPADGPRQLWKRPLGKGYSSILYRDGQLFTLYREADDEVAVSLDARTGATRWQHRASPKLWREMSEHFGIGPNATPLLIADRLIAVGIAGNVRGLDPASGELAWELDLPREFRRRRRVEEYGYSGSPLPYDGKAIVMVGGNRHAVIALDPGDGSAVWKSESGGVSYAQPTITELAGRDHYVYFSPQGVVGLDPATGETLWRAPIEFNNGNHLTPAVRCDDRHLWVGSQFDSGGGRLIEITGEGDDLAARQLWFKVALQASHWTKIRLGDYIYGSTGGNRTSYLAAFHWRTGEIAWRERGFHKAQALYARTAGGGDKLLFLDENGRLVLARVSPQGFELLASAQVTERVSWTLPTLVSTTLYLRDQEHILALDLGKPGD